MTPEDIQASVEVEDAIISLLSSLWTMYDGLPELHPLDKRTFQDALHKAQAIVCARPKIRGILMARQGIVPQQTQQLNDQPTQLATRSAIQPATRPAIVNQQGTDSLSDQPVNIPLRAGEKACAVPIHGTGGMKTLPGAQ